MNDTVVKRIPIVPKGEMTRKQKRLLAYNMRVAGHSVKGIAVVMGCSEARVARLLKHTLTHVADTTRSTPDQMRALELERLDQLITPLWPYRFNSKVNEAILKVLERRHRLSGLEVTKSEWIDKTKPESDPTSEDTQLDMSLLDAKDKADLQRILQKAAPRPRTPLMRPPTTPTTH